MTTKRNRIFRAWHGMTRAEYMSKAAGWARVFVVLNLLLMLVCCATLGLAIADLVIFDKVFRDHSYFSITLASPPYHLALTPSSPRHHSAIMPPSLRHHMIAQVDLSAITITATGTLLVLSVLGLVGVGRLKSDLSTDPDGKETLAQRLIEARDRAC